VVSHDNIHIPRESFPSWIWFVIEFFIVLAISLVISWKIMDVFHEFDITLQNLIFWSLVGGIFVLWYIVIRNFVLKKNILENRS